MNGDHRRSKTAFIAALTLLACVVLWENHDMPSHIEECLGADDKVSSLADASYRWLISLSTFLSPNDESVHILTLTSGEEPDEILANICLQRHFMAKLITQLKKDHVTVIAIDKRYSEKACTSDPSADAELVTAAQSDGNTTIVIGVDADVAPSAEQKFADRRRVCFRLRHHLQFVNVKYGLIRFDRDTRRVPLSWPTLDTMQPFRSLSLVTAEAKSPSITARSRLRRMLNTVENMHEESAANPFARLYPRDTIGASSALKALCGHEANAMTDWRSCSIGAEDNKFSGNIILIGDHTAADKHESALGPIYGVDLHANYLAAVLSDQIYTPIGDRFSNGVGAAAWFIIIQVIFFLKRPTRFFSERPLTKKGLICIALWFFMLAISIGFSLAGYLFMPWVQVVSLGVILVSWIEHGLHSAALGH
jgi:hypothetical protein